jgi:hypothetical protein
LSLTVPTFKNFTANVLLNYSCNQRDSFGFCFVYIFCFFLQMNGVKLLKVLLILGGKSVALVRRNFFVQLQKHQL